MGNTRSKLYLLIDCEKCKCMSVIGKKDINNSKAACPCCQHIQIVDGHEDYLPHQLTNRYEHEKERLNKLVKKSITKAIKKNENDIWICKVLSERGNCYINMPITPEFIFHIKQICKFDIAVRPTMFIESGYVLERIK